MVTGSGLRRSRISRKGILGPRTGICIRFRVCRTTFNHQLHLLTVRLRPRRRKYLVETVSHEEMAVPWETDCDGRFYRPFPSPFSTNSISGNVLLQQHEIPTLIFGALHVPLKGRRF